jgi:hypothetical protein
MMQRSLALIVVCAASAAFLAERHVFTQPVTVRRPEGVVRVPLSLSSLDGTLLADGTLVQQPEGDRVASTLTFRFKDGSIQEETTVFTQRDFFRVLTHQLVQKGPAFSQPLDMSIDAQTGQVVVRYVERGQQKVDNEHLALPSDLANGILPVILKNLGPSGPFPTVSMVAATPEPRLVKLAFSARPTSEAVRIAGSSVQATHFVVKVEIGGVTGLLAPMVGKQPPDVHVWILAGDTPAFLKSEGPLFYNGAPWRIEVKSLTSK